MSFLKRIRQQQNKPEVQQGLRLGYFLCLADEGRDQPDNQHSEMPAVSASVLSGNNAQQQLRLRLGLVEIRNRLPVTTPQPYELNPEHLTLPPPFIEAADLPILKFLLESSQPDRPQLQPDPLLHRPMKSDSSWSLAFTGIEPEKVDWFFRELWSVERCYINTAGPRQTQSRWVLSKPGPARPVKPDWSIEGLGRQQLTWIIDSGPGAGVDSGQSSGQASGQSSGSHRDSGSHKDLNNYIVSLGSQPWYFLNSGEIGRCTHNLSAEALLELSRVPQQISVLELDAFIENYQHPWQALGLPLPGKLAIAEVQANVVPLLRCRSCFGSARSADDRLELEFGYFTHDYCFNVTGNDNEPDHYYYDNSRFCRIPRQFDREQKLHGQLVHELEALGFQALPVDANSGASEPGDARARVYCWRVPEPPGRTASYRSFSAESWKRLLTAGREKLASRGFQFLLSPGFRYPYVGIDKWRVDLEKNGAKQWCLSLKLFADGEFIDIASLLEHLHAGEMLGGGFASVFDGPSDDVLTVRLRGGRSVLLSRDQIFPIVEELGDLAIKQPQASSPTNRFNEPSWSPSFDIERGQLYRLQHLAKLLPDDTDWRGDTTLLAESAAMEVAAEQLDWQTLSAVNTGLQNQLRPYQWQGVCWLQHLTKQGINGLLADDMGLGKTVQTLVHLSLEKQQGRLINPALIVAPTSLLHNWAQEINRFTPDLRYLVLQGTARHDQWQNRGGYDVLITSYGLVCRDLHLWALQHLSWLILDEAQAIKNPRTLTSRAIKQLVSDHRLCLSGTPLENHLGEIWSIMDFLMPRNLDSETRFNRYFRTPIEKLGSDSRMALLLKRLAPLMLRRRKDEVARDLPSKTLIHQPVSMGEEQWKLYQRVKSGNWTRIQKQLQQPELATNPARQRMFVLSALLRLRQVCCDPQLLGEADIASAKRQQCLDMVQELVAEGRCLLIFSQFTRMLDILAEDLEKLGIEYLMLTGKTRDRQTRIDRFQAGAVPVFLISLKAGGVGLNLTRADTVIHYDPWWNSAAEQQASDRAHRIGQDKPVFIYKLIVENSIEQKIAELQSFKSQLSDSVNHRAEASGQAFGLHLEELLKLCETDHDSGNGNGNGNGNDYGHYYENEQTGEPLPSETEIETGISEGQQ